MGQFNWWGRKRNQQLEMGPLIVELREVAAAEVALQAFLPSFCYARKRGENNSKYQIAVHSTTTTNPFFFDVMRTFEPVLHSGINFYLD